MKPKAYIFAGLAIVCGLGASYMTSRLLAERTTDEAEKVEILVAKRTLSVHERILRPEEMFEFKAVTKENEPPDAVRDFEVLRGKSMKNGRNKGEFVTLANINELGGLQIPEGHQAVGVPVNLQTSVHGLANLPGSRVNLLLTMRGSDPRLTKAIILLEAVTVLAADTRVTPEGEIAAPAQVVTFALKGPDVLTVTAAKDMGTISLVLRGKDDYTAAKEREITGATILDRNKVAPPADVAPLPVVVKETPKTDTPKVEEQPKDIRSVLIQNGANPSRYDYEVLPNGQIRDAAPGSVPSAPPSVPQLKGSQSF